jgi:hypothetical protein
LKYFLLKFLIFSRPDLRKWSKNTYYVAKSSLCVYIAPVLSVHNFTYLATYVQVMSQMSESRMSESQMSESQMSESQMSESQMSKSQMSEKPFFQISLLVMQFHP